MSLFFEYPTDLLKKPKGSLITSAWSISHSDPPYWAISTSSGDVSIFNEEGARLEPDMTLHRDASQCLALAWHPASSLLATCWSDGSIFLWSMKDGSVKESLNAHKAGISFVIWSPEGSRLITADQTGTLAVWSTDHRGRLTSVCKHVKQGVITHCVFRAPPTINANDVSSAMMACPPFFWGGTSGGSDSQPAQLLACVDECRR